MGNVIDLNAYRLFKAVQKNMSCDGLKCKFSYDNQYFLDQSKLLINKNIDFPTFYNNIAAYSMSLGAGLESKDPKPPTKS